MRFEDLREQSGPRQEIFDGSLHVSPPVEVSHQIIVAELSASLQQVVPGDLRVLTGVNVLRRSDTDRLLIPDIAVAHAAATKRAVASGADSLRPEDIYLVVEVISPSSREIDLHLKNELYAQWKIGTYWVLDPETRELHEFGWRASAGTWLVDVDGIWPD